MAEAIAAHYIDDLEIGQSASYTRTVTEADVQQFGAVSGDFNPLHFNEEYAKTTIFRGRIAHGVLSLSYISTVLGTQLPGAGFDLSRRDGAIQGAGANWRHRDGDLHREGDQPAAQSGHFRLRLQSRRYRRCRMRNTSHGAVAKILISASGGGLPGFSG